VVFLNIRLLTDRKHWTEPQRKLNYLREQLLVVTPQQFPVVRDALLPHKAAVSEKLWSLQEDQSTAPDVRLRAAAALATYTLDDPRWEPVSGDVAARLVVQNPLVLGIWTEALQPVAKFLLPPLASFLKDEKRRPCRLTPDEGGHPKRDEQVEQFAA
jgi:hypothetical protein